MPKKLERKLEREADAKGYTGARKDRYVYGTMNKVKKEEKKGGRTARKVTRSPVRRKRR